MVRNSVRVRTRWQGMRDRNININRAVYLEYDGALKDDEHEEGKETVVPVLVETPESDTEYLKDKKGGGCVFCKEFCEGGNGDVELVLAIEGEEMGSVMVSDGGGGEESVEGRSVRAGIRETVESGGREGGECVGVSLVRKRK